MSANSKRLRPAAHDTAPDRNRLGFLAASVGLHAAGLIAAALFAATAPKSDGEAHTVHVSLVSAPGSRSGGVVPSPSDGLASQLQSLTGQLSPASSPSATPQTAPQAPALSLDDLMPSKPGGGGPSSGQAGGTAPPIDKDPYAHASLAGDASVAAATQLREQVMACWLGGRASPPVIVRIELAADGSLRRRPVVVRSAGALGGGPMDAAALQATAECAPYRLRGAGLRRAGAYEIAIG